MFRRNDMIRESQIFVRRFRNGWPGLQSRPPAPSEGVSARRFAAIQPFLEPIQDFGLNPPHPGGAKVYPLGELPGLLQSCDVLRRIQDKLLELTL